MPRSQTTLPEQVDGRRARGERTRLRVLEALLALVEEGELRPTAQDVAARAGVALRTVYHHFEDVEALRRMALDLQLARHWEILQPLDDGAALDDRVHAMARQLRKLFEALTPIRRATLFDEHSSPEMADGLRAGREVRRNHVAQAFGTEISARGSEGKVLLDALDTATAWQSWYYLRNGLGRSAVATEKVLSLTLHNLLT